KEGNAMKTTRLIIVIGLLCLLVSLPGIARDRGGQVAWDVGAYFNDVYGITLEFPEIHGWEFELADLKTDVRGEYIIVEILKAKLQDSNVGLCLRAATDPALMGTGMTNWDYYSSLRRALKAEPRQETTEFIFLHGFYEGILWRYTASMGGGNYRFVNYLTRRPGANFCLTFHAPTDEMDEAWEEVEMIADTVRFYDSVLLGGEMKRIFIELNY
ncbi:hypothetical protein ACFLT7_08295, partial [candidate division KSB1 bacterium]